MDASTPQIPGVDPGPMLEASDRLLNFIYDDVRYALPIAWVVEVAEKDRVTGVPSLGLPVGGVMNWHGEALPLVASELLLGREEAGATPFGAATTVGYSQEQILVVSEGPDSGAVLGMPVDRVIGLIDGGVERPGAGRELIIERRPVEGRIVHILDPATLVARGAEVIEGATH